MDLKQNSLLKVVTTEPSKLMPKKKMLAIHLGLEATVVTFSAMYDCFRKTFHCSPIIVLGTNLDVTFSVDQKLHLAYHRTKFQ